MLPNLNILVTNDDGYKAKGLKVLVEIMKKFGKVTVIAPKTHQSGMSMALSLGCPIAVRHLPSEGDGVERYYVDGTPASCVKYGFDVVFADRKPDVVVSGINHGSNAATAANYSGTLGAAEEAALSGVLGIGLSLCTPDPDADFSVVEKRFPEVFTKLMENRPSDRSVLYNVNVPYVNDSELKGIRVGHQGMGNWIRVFEPWDHVNNPNPYPSIDEGEEIIIMKGAFIDESPAEDTKADHHLLDAGYITITAQGYDRSDYKEIARLESGSIEEDFR